MKYNIHCKVSGGITGDRQSLLKVEGTVQFFNDRAAAEEKARYLNQSMNNKYSIAKFEYRVVPANCSCGEPDLCGCASGDPCVVCDLLQRKVAI